MHKIVTAIICFVFSLSGIALAGEYPIMSDSTIIGQNYGYPQATPETTGVRDLDLVVETTFFLKNLEIVDLPIDGETFIGYVAPVRLRYRAHEDITVEAGVVLGKHFGDDEDIDEVEPLFRIVYEPMQAMFIIGGTLINTHPMHDALYNDVNSLQEVAEQGFQLRVDKNRLKEDMWINWRIRETSTRAERFVFANSTQIRYNNLHLDGQLYWAHTGGQKNTDDRLENNITLLAGGSYGFSPGFLNEALHLKEIRMGGYYLYNYDYARNIKESNGEGFEGRITTEMMRGKNTLITLFGSYFIGDNLLARDGDPLYSMDRYAQLGTNILFYLPAGLRIEVGLVGQFVEDKFVHTEQIYLTWGRAFNLLRNI